ncbi:hypothetical protein ABLE94_00715 [Gordonia sp. VNK1]|uniref:hypothetical protein n=1 Tax=Gordonia oleivorans TaxID=3156618 RepID=UPI0032B4D268
MADSEVTGIPPALDLGRHLRKVARMAIPAAVIAAIAFGITAWVLASAPAEYKATLTAQIDAQTPAVASEAYIYQMTAPYMALTASDAVQQGVADRVGNGWTPADVPSHVTVELAKSPLLLTVSATADSPETALNAATAMVSELDTKARVQRVKEIALTLAAPQAEVKRLTSQLNSLPNASPEREIVQDQLTAATNQVNQIRAGGINGLSVLSTPAASEIPRAGASIWVIALFVAVIVWILAVEALVWGRSRWGRTVNQAWAERISQRERMTLERCRNVWPDLPIAAASAVGAAINDGRSVVAVLSPATDPVPMNRPITQISTRDAEWEYQLSPAAVVLFVVAEGETGRPQIADIAHAVSTIGSTTFMILQPKGSGLRNSVADATQSEDVPEEWPGAPALTAENRL